jgi:hypothetical protein
LAYLSGLLCGLAVLTYSAGYLGLVLYFGVWVFFFPRRRGEQRGWKSLFLALCLGWVLAAGAYVFGNLLGGRSVAWKAAASLMAEKGYAEFVYPDLDVTQYPTVRVGRVTTVFFDLCVYVRLFLRGALSTLLNLVTDGVVWKHYLVGPLTGPGVVFFLAGLARVLRHRRHAVLWGGWLALPLVLLSMLNAFPPRPSHMVVIIPALAILVAVGVWLLCDLLARLWRALPAGWYHGIGVGLVVMIALLGLYAYFVEMPRMYPQDLDNVMLWRALEMGEKAVIVFVAEHNVLIEYRAFVLGIESLRWGGHYRPISIKSLPSTSLCDEDGVACRVFFLPKDSDVVSPQLYHQLGRGTIHSHYDQDGQVIVLEFMPP